MRRALELIAEQAKPIPLEQAKAREEIWTPEKEQEEKGALWTPGSGTRVPRGLPRRVGDAAVLDSREVGQLVRRQRPPSGPRCRTRQPRTVRMSASRRRWQRVQSASAHITAVRRSRARSSSIPRPASNCSLAMWSA